MKIYNKMILLYLGLSAHVVSSQPVFDSIFPHQYFMGTYLGIPYTATPGILPRDWLLHDIERLNIYSWVNPTYNLSSSKQSNLPMGFSYLPNQVQFNEAVLGVEKQVDTLQQESIDFGFNITGEFGTDYRYGLMKGVFSQQYINQNLVYGFDPVLFNAQFFIPGIGKGSLITIGRYYAPGDIEFPLSNLNYLVSHSLTFTYSAFTQMGVNVNTKFNNNWSLFLGIHAASDNSAWSNSGQPSFVSFVQWISNDKQDSIWFGSNAINNGQYKNAWNNIQQINLIWSHRFSEDFFIEMSSYYEYQFNALVGGNCTQGPVRSFNLYPSCNYVIPGRSDSWSLLGFLEKKWTENDFSSFRAEFFNDFQGQRTGFITPYLEFTLGLTHVFGNVLKLRPEVRFDTALNATPYDNGNRKSLVMGLVDFILLL
jgi:hypothetical protein